MYFLNATLSWASSLSVPIPWSQTLSANFLSRRSSFFEDVAKVQSIASMRSSQRWISFAVLPRQQVVDTIRSLRFWTAIIASVKTQRREKHKASLSRTSRTSCTPATIACKDSTESSPELSVDTVDLPADGMDSISCALKISKLYRRSRSDPASCKRQSTNASNLASQACATCVRLGPVMRPPVMGWVGWVGGSKGCFDKSAVKSTVWRCGTQPQSVSPLLCNNLYAARVVGSSWFLQSTKDDTKNAALTPMGIWAAERLKVGQAWQASIDSISFASRKWQGVSGACRKIAGCCCLRFCSSSMLQHFD